MTRIVIDRDVSIPLRDGYRTFADVYRPGARGKYPVILGRTPFQKHEFATVHQPWFDLLGLVRAGYVVVVQNVRGTGPNSGIWQPFVGDGRDGADSVAWAAAQHWSTGAVGMAGKSSHAVTQLLTAGEGPRALRALAPMSVEYHMRDGFFYEGGAFQLGQAMMSFTGVALVNLLRDGSSAAAPDGAREQLEAIVANIWSAYRSLPLLHVAGVTPWLDSTLGEYLRQPGSNAYWRETAVSERYTRVEVPALHIVGWYDSMLKGTLRSYEAIRDEAATELARENQRLIITPWAHTVQREVMGDLWLGPEAGPGFAAIHDAHLEWFDTWLKGTPRVERHPVRLFVMGANRWRDEPAWPLSRAVPTRWYLHAAGGLSPVSPDSGEAPGEYEYDPRDPVPTVCGQTVMADGGYSAGPRDRRSIYGRPDVLVYSSDVLQADIEVTGWITATLHVASSAPDTDFTATLVDVHPDGRAFGLTEGILRLRYRGGYDRPRLIEPGRPYEITINTIATSNLFIAGHRIAVEISSSNFPRFDRNPNIAGAIAEAEYSELQTARQTVFHDARRASYVTLPVIPPGPGSAP